MVAQLIDSTNLLSRIKQSMTMRLTKRQMIVNLSIELMFYIKDKINKMVRSAGVE